MKYRCLGPFKFEGKEYKFGDVVQTNKKIEKSGVLVVIDNTEEKATPKEEKKEETKPKSSSRRK